MSDERSTSTVEGVVKFLKKDKKGVCLEDGKWYGNGFLKEDLQLNKGDKVKLTLNAKGFLINAEVTEKTKQDYKTGSSVDPDIRILVDTGNTLQQAVNLTIAVLNTAKVSKNAEEVLHAAAEACVREFLAIKLELQRDGVPTPKESMPAIPAAQKGIPKQTFNEEGEYL